MKDILTRNVNDFRYDVFRLTVSQLKGLGKGMFEFAKNRFHNIQDKQDPRYEQMLDIERKQTIIMKELQRRKVLSKHNIQEYYAYLTGGHNRRVY